MSEEKPLEDNVENDTTANETSTLQEELEKAKKDHLYLLAEFDNYRKNAIKERSDLVKYGSERLVRDLLEVMDNFERALKMELTAENMAIFQSGVNMIFSETKALLQKHGVKELDVMGKPFDPNTQEAVSSEPTDAVEPGHVSQVFKGAYKMHDRLIRPAQVVVAVEPQKN